MVRFSVGLVTFGALLVIAVAPSFAAGVTSRTEVIRAPAPSPIDLVGTGFAWGVRTGKGDPLPAGGSLVRGWVTFPAGTAPGTTASLTLRCPANQRVVELAGLWALPPLRLEPYFVALDRSTEVTFRWATRGGQGTPQRTGRATLICYDAGRLAALRAQQERAIVRRAAEKRPEVLTAPRRRLCRTTPVRVRPPGPILGTVFRSDPVRVLRLSASGRFAEILGLRAFNGIGWIPTAALCRIAFTG